MSNNKTNAKAKIQGKSATGHQPKKSNFPLIIIALAVTCAAAIAVVVGNNVGGSSESPVNVQKISAGEYLNIPTAEISSTASFYPIEVDGTQMEVFAIKASDGTIRTAFNTCQSCYLSGAGYYVQQGDDLVCQNCGFHFTPDQVEIQSGGCNPWPIFAEDKNVTEESIQISYDFLKSSSSIFSNWKK